MLYGRQQDSQNDLDRICGVNSHSVSAFLADDCYRAIFTRTAGRVLYRASLVEGRALTRKCEFAITVPSFPVEI
jgi:hypothetical protein